MACRRAYLLALALTFLIITNCRAALAQLVPEPVGTASPASDAASPGADDNTAVVDMYRSAVIAMNALPQPEYVAFTTTLASSDGVVYVENDNGQVEIQLSLGNIRPPRDYASVYRSADALAAVEFSDGGRGLARGGIFNPTWSAAESWMHFGLHSPVAVPTPASDSAAPPASDEPAAVPGEPATIGGATVYSVLNYRLSDGGPTVCPGGSPARRIHFVAYRDPDRHPLTDVSVDPAGNRICAMSFQIFGSGLVSYRGEIELRFSTVGPYDLVTEGVVDVEAHALGLLRKHVSMTFARKEFRFPPALPENTFAAIDLPVPAMESPAP